MADAGNVVGDESKSVGNIVKSKLKRAREKISEVKITSFLEKPYNWFLLGWIILATLNYGGISIPLWVIYICIIPFCMAVMLHYVREFRQKIKGEEEAPDWPGSSHFWNMIINISPTLFLVIQIILLIVLFKSKDDIINNNRKIPDNFIWFKNLINIFICCQALLILYYINNPSSRCDLGLWAILVFVITSTLASIQYIWLILTKLITDG